MEENTEDQGINLSGAFKNAKGEEVNLSGAFSSKPKSTKKTEPTAVPVKKKDQPKVVVPTTSVSKSVSAPTKPSSVLPSKKVEKPEEVGYVEDIWNRLKGSTTNMLGAFLNVPSSAQTYLMDMALAASGKDEEFNRLPAAAKKEVTSAAEAADLYGYGSPIHSIMRILRPTTGDGVGGIPTVVFPQVTAGGATATVRAWTVTGTATSNATHTVVVNGRKYPNIITVETQQGHPKSDFNLINSDGKPVIFISHKKASHKGASADDFIRWGGFSEYNDYNDVIQFIDKLKELMVDKGWNEIPRAANFIKEIESDELAKKIVFGKDYGSNSFGKDNVTIAIQGTVKLEPTDENGVYNLTGEHYYYNGDNPVGEYRPVLTGKYRSDRTMFGIPKLETIAQPAGVAHKSSNIYELKGDKFVQIKEPKVK